MAALSPNIGPHRKPNVETCRKESVNGRNISGGSSYFLRPVYSGFAMIPSDRSYRPRIPTNTDAESRCRTAAMQVEDKDRKCRE